MNERMFPHKVRYHQWQRLPVTRHGPLQKWVKGVWQNVAWLNRKCEHLKSYYWLCFLQDCTFDFAPIFLFLLAVALLVGAHLSWANLPHQVVEHLQQTNIHFGNSITLTTTQLNNSTAWHCKHRMKSRECWTTSIQAIYISWMLDGKRHQN